MDTMRESVFKELLARSEDGITANLTDTWKEKMDEEVKRQMELDKLDVQFLFIRELNLNDASVTSMLQEEDEVVLYFAAKNLMDNERVGMVLTWKKGARGKFGRVPTGTIAGKVDHHTTLTPAITKVPTQLFVQPASEVPIYEEEGSEITPGFLSADKATYLTWKDGKDHKQLALTLGLRRTYNNQSGNGGPAILDHIDFRVRAPKHLPLKTPNTSSP